jgi:hypothetical protein
LAGPAFTSHTATRDELPFASDERRRVRRTPIVLLARLSVQEGDKAMTIKTLLIGGSGLAALAAATPSTAQYYGYPYGYSQYGYAQPYGYSRPYGYAYGYRSMNTSVAASQCTAAVQNRLYTRNGLSGILGSLVGAYGTQGRVLSITRITPNNSGVRVRGLASSGRYGYGYGYNTADLSFKCDVDYRGFVRDVDIRRR